MVWKKDVHYFCFLQMYFQFTYMRYKGVVHLQCFQKDGPEPGLHHPKSMPYNGACPGMMKITALGSHTSYWPLVGSDEGERVLETWVPSVCEDEVPWRRVV